MASYVLLVYSKIKYVQNLYAVNLCQKTQIAILLIGMHRRTQHSPPLNWALRPVSATARWCLNYLCPQYNQVCFPHIRAEEIRSYKLGMGTPITSAEEKMKFWVSFSFFDSEHVGKSRSTFVFTPVLTLFLPAVSLITYCLISNKYFTIKVPCHTTVIWKAFIVKRQNQF